MKDIHKRVGIGREFWVTNQPEGGGNGGELIRSQVGR